MEKVRLISEAFSMQPCTLQVSPDTPNSRSNPDACKEIKLEDYGQYPDKEMYYVGYNFAGNKIFKYIASAVNVHYDTYEPEIKTS